MKRRSVPAARLTARGLSRRSIALLGAAVIGLLIGRLEEFWARFGGERKNEEDGEGVSSDLLLAVSSASPVPLPDVPQDFLDQKSRFTIVLEQEAAAPDALFADTPDVIIGDRALAGELLPPAPDRSDEDDDDEGILLWRGDEGSAPAISQAESGARADSTGEILSETPLPQAEAITESDPRFVSITQLNEQMGPPASEDEDDEGGWLWFGDGLGVWLVSTAAGLLGGVPGARSAAATATAASEATVSGLNIGFAAGPFVDGKLTIKAVDGEGNPLFTYRGETPGKSLGDGVTLTGVATDTVGQQSVITGLNVEFDDFSGPVFLQVEDTSSYIDEALGTETQLDIPLRGAAEVPSEGIGEISLTPFTELAIQLIEQATGNLVTLDASNADNLAASRELLDSAADRVRDLTGVDIRDTRPVAVNQASFQSSDDFDANQYGLKLAALSEAAGEEDSESRVQSAITRLIKDVSPISDPDQGTIVFQNPGTALRNQTEFTNSLDDFVDGDDSIRERVIDADRPVTPPTIDEFLVIDGVPVIEGAAQFIDRANTALEDSNLSLSVALGDDTVFSVDADGGSGDGALTVVEAGDADTAGTWRLTLSDLDPGAYSLDVFVIDGASNTTQADTGTQVIRGDTADNIIDQDKSLINGDPRTTENPEFIFGDAGDDIIFGYGGDDTLLGEQDDDVLIGGHGDDTLVGGAGDDFISGGPGDDLYRLDSLGVELGTQNLFMGNEGVDTVELAGETGDYLLNRVSTDRVEEFNALLADENGEFRGFELPDLQFDVDQPVLRIDRVTEEGRQTDYVQAERFEFADATLGYSEQGSSNILPILTTEIEQEGFVFNGGGRPLQEFEANLVDGSASADRLIGGDGDDQLSGGGGDDVLVSPGGSSVLDGEEGDDVLVAFGTEQGGAPSLTGGEGIDDFLVALQPGSTMNVVIEDFQSAEERIFLPGLAADDNGTPADPDELMGELIDSLSNSRGEIDLSEFYVADSEADSGYSAVGGALEIHFAESTSATDLDGSSVFNVSNPLESEDWWQTLIETSGLT